MDMEDPFAEGMKLFNAGQLKEAILAFEACVQKVTANAAEPHIPTRNSACLLSSASGCFLTDLVVPLYAGT
jgi:hypothetical protein